MDAVSRTKLAKLEQLASTEARKHREKARPTFPDFVIRYHTIAAAAIVLEGRPKIEEPLIKAWKRTLRHFKIEVQQPHLLEGQMEAASQLWRNIKTP
jgi:hypothetical protein